MPRLRLDAADIARELVEFERRLARAPLALATSFDPRSGATPRELVARLEGTALYRYEAPRRHPALAPLLVVYALVNRPTMTDLMPGRSLVAGMLDRGIDVYLIEWGDPPDEAPGLTIEDYIERYLATHVETLRRASGHERINMLGICQGGVFSLCYAALHPDRVRNVITTVTPIDFHTPRDTLSRLVRHIDPALLAGSATTLPGGVLNALFLLLKPYRLTQQKYLDLIDQIHDPEATRLFLKMEQWIFDSPSLAIPALIGFVRCFYQGNGFVANNVTIGGQAVVLSRLRLPILNILARDDHLVPPASSRALRGLVGSPDYTELELPGGHIGMYVSARSAGRIAGTVAEWLAKR